MNTNDIMQLALDLVGFDEIPGDSAIYVPGDNIKSVMFGIDIEPAELLVAREIGVDAVIAHHPAGGSAYAHYHEVLWKHKALLVKHGVPEDTAHRVVEPFVFKSIVDNHKKNHDHIPSVARLLNIPFMNIHNPCDELGRRIIAKKIEDYLDSQSTLEDLRQCLMELPEFRKAITNIEIRMGEPGNKAGRIAVVHGAGTNGGAAIARTYFENGIDTVLYIHISPDELLDLRNTTKGNLVISGHIASDAVGINPLIFEMEKRGIQVIRMSGL